MGDMTTKLCINCYRKHFGPEAKVKILTWSRLCWECKTPTEKLGLLIKCDVIADMAKPRQEAVKTP